MPLPVPKSELIGSSVEMIGYGVYLVVFFQCMNVLRSKSRRGVSVAYLWIIALTLFGLVTAHLIVDIVRFMAAFTNHMDTPNAPAKYYAVVNSPLDVAKTAIYCTVTLISDGLIVYRLFVVWQRNYFIAVVPMLAFLADIGMSAWFIYSLHLVKPADNVLEAKVTQRAVYFYSVTLIVNAICTFGISYKIWTIQRNISDYTVGSRSSSRMNRIITTIVESAAIYSAWLVVLIVTSAVGKSAFFILLNSISPVIGTVFSAVIIRVSTDSMNITTTTAVGGGSSQRFWKDSNPSKYHSGLQGSGTNPSTGGVQISLDTVTHRDVGELYAMDKISHTSQQDQADSGKDVLV